MIKWNILNEETQLKTLLQESENIPVLIYKHSATCSISALMKHRLESRWEDNISSKNYFLDLLSYRPVSNAVAEVFSIRHESPQVILVSKGKAVYNASHNGIEYRTLKKEIENLIKIQKQ